MVSKMNKNLKLWDAVEKTDLQFTKHVNQRGGYTAISPQYQLKCATEQFGAYGAGFGLSVSDFDMSIFEATGIVIHKAMFFYMMDGQRYEFPLSNAIEAAKTTKNGRYVDTDFAKKVETNTVSKALSKLGFNADVFMGMMEDQSYLAELQNEMALQKADDKDAEIINQRLEYDAWKQNELKVYPSLQTLNALTTVYTGHVRKCKRHNDDAGILLFKSAYEDRKAQLEQAQ
jgi:signal recognition particle subunit SEC65